MATHRRFALAAVLAACLTFVQPLGSQSMTPEEEAAYTTLFSQTQLAQDLLAQGKLAEAEQIFAALLALVDDKLPNEPLTRAAALHNLAAARAELGDLASAETLARSALAVRDDPENLGARTSTQALLASILIEVQAWAEALSLMDQVVRAQLQTPDMPRQSLMADMSILAVLYAQTGDFAATEQIFAQLEPLLPDVPPEVAVRVFAGLGRLHSLAGKPELAEAAYRKVLDLTAGLAYGAGWRRQEQAVALGNLASILQRQGRNAEAIPIFRKAIALLKDAGLGDGLAAANLLDGLGNALKDGGDFGEAWQFQRLALENRFNTLPPGSPFLAASFATLGETLFRTGELDIADQTLARAVSLAQSAGDPYRVARASLTRAAVKTALGAPAVDLAAGAVAELSNILPEGHPDLLRAQFSAAWIALSEDQPGLALPLARNALAGFTQMAGRIGADATIAATQDPNMRRQILALPVAAYALDRDGLIGEAFEAVQWALATRIARATQRMAARFAAGSDDLAQEVRAKQDLVNLWALRDAEYLDALTTGGDAPGLLTDLRRIEAEIARIDETLAARFPDYARLVAPGALSLPEAQARLTLDEALLVLVTTPDETYAFAISSDQALWHRAPSLSEAALRAQVTALRAELDPTAPTRAAAALEAPTASGPAYDRQSAYGLYQDLIAPLAPVLGEAPRILVVADGPLSSLPLAVLVASLPEGEDADPEALTQTDWLGLHHAFATLPSIQSLSSLSERPRLTKASGFAGFGAPNFGGTAQPLALSRFYDSEAAKAEALRGLAPLPATGRELRGLARSLNAAEGSLFLGAEATETAVKSADLGNRAVVAFATHGLIAGDITGLAEPALAFSPPANPNALDDGVLTASEAAQLTLAADWVILSACNTAAADGTPGAEGLSGLATAFLYAGARGLLVSHWPVRDDAAADLTQGAVSRMADNPSLGQAEALQQAMLAVMQKPGLAHPSAWGPFVVVGDGR
jgi:CHAT domain-containing protein